MSKFVGLIPLLIIGLPLLIVLENRPTDISPVSGTIKSLHPGGSRLTKVHGFVGFEEVKPFATVVVNGKEYTTDPIGDLHEGQCVWVESRVGRITGHFYEAVDAHAGFLSEPAPVCDPIN